MRRLLFVITLLLVSGCAGMFQARYEPHSAFLLAEIKTLSLLGEVECGKIQEAKYIRLTWEKTFLLLTYINSTDISDSRNYSITIHEVSDSLYSESIVRNITTFFCKEQYLNIRDLVDIGIEIEQLRR